MWESELLNGYARHLSFADVDGNGYENIIAATYDRLQILNATNGIKDWYQAVAGTIHGTATGDFNDDGIADIACSGGAEFSGDDPAKAVWAFKTVEVSPVLWETPVGQYGNGLALGDFTGDSALDVIGVTSDDQAYALEGSTGDLLWLWNATENLYTVATGDFNDDGIDDAAVAGNDDMVTALNGYDGDILWQFTLATDQFYRKCVQTLDVNNDGHMDVIAGSDDSYVYAINGDTGGLLWSRDLNGSVRDIDLYDMNNDGMLDVIATASLQIAVLDGVTGSFLWDYDVDVSSAKNAAVLDGNDDGIMDVAWGSYTKVQLINGATQALMWSQPISVSSEYSLTGEDANEDEYDDVIIGGGSDGQNVIALHGLDGSQIWTFPTGGDINCVITGDVNQNGINELLVGSDDQTVYVLNRNGYELWNYATADDVMHIGLGDITGDTLPNIVAITFGFDGVLYGFRTLAQETNDAPQANFSFQPTSPTTADMIQFTDTSTDDGTIISWNWDFGDGNTSTMQNPTHQYAQPGDYQVTLTVMDDKEAIGSITKTISVLSLGPVAAFSFSPLYPIPGDPVSFTDESVDTSGDTINGWYWEFGDGDTSTMQHPSHTYSANGSYLVNLTVTNTSGASDTTSELITVGMMNFNTTLEIGWNLMTLPVNLSWNASDLADQIPGCLSVSKWDNVNQTYYTYIVGGPPTFDFPLQRGHGYFVDASQQTMLSVSGPPINAVNVSLLPGWNLLGWYHQTSTMASSLSDNITGCSSVSRWNATAQTYNTYIVGGPDTFDFVIDTGMGVFVDVTEQSYWYGE